jgi:carbamoyltransferase
LSLADFHANDSGFTVARLRTLRDKLARGETIYLVGIGPPGTHHSGVALVEVTAANGPRLILNNEEERFAADKHSTQYPRAALDAMRDELRAIGGDVGDIDAWFTTWDYADLAGMLVRSVIEEFPASLKLLRQANTVSFDKRRLRQMTRTPLFAGASIRPARARAADDDAASRQSCMVFVRRVALPRR